MRAAAASLRGPLGPTTRSGSRFQLAADVQQRRDQHDHERVDEEPAGVGDGRIATVGEGDQDVDEEGTAHHGMKHHGGDDLAEQVLSGGVHAEQACQGRQEEHEQGHAGEDQGHHRGAGFAARRPPDVRAVAVRVVPMNTITRPVRSVMLIVVANPLPSS